MADLTRQTGPAGTSEKWIDLGSGVYEKLTAVDQHGTWSVTVTATTALPVTVTNTAAISVTVSTVDPANTARTTATKVIPVQVVDAGGIAGAVNGNVAAGAADSGNPLKTGGVYRLTPPTRTDGQRGDFEIDANENLKITLATLIAGEDLTFSRMSVQESYSFLSIPTQTTTQVKTGAGKLKRIVIPTQVASATVKIYDNTAASGTVIMDTLTMPATLLNEGPFTIEFGAAFATGLCIITAGATMPIDVFYL